MDKLSSLVVSKLLEINASVSTAESCTGGLIAATIVNTSGASGCFNEGYITYSNEAKIKNLGVLDSTLAAHGAVSYETASQMACGVKKKACATFGISSTGIAGPTGGTKEKPVGLIYIACAYNDKVEVKELRLKGDRTANRNETVKEALELLNHCIDLYKESL